MRTPVAASIAGGDDASLPVPPWLLLEHVRVGAPPRQGEEACRASAQGASMATSTEGERSEQGASMASTEGERAEECERRTGPCRGLASGGAPAVTRLPVGLS